MQSINRAERRRSRRESAKRPQAVSELLPQLYLHGLAQGDFELALRGLLGDGAPLSASSIERLRAKWQLEFEAWRSRRLDSLEVVYAWADGLYVKAGLEDSKAALLVIVGALRDGRKVVLAIESGQRESKESWARVLRDLFARGCDLGGPRWPMGTWGSGRRWARSSRTAPSCVAGIIDSPT